MLPPLIPPRFRLLPAVLLMAAAAGFGAASVQAHQLHWKAGPPPPAELSGRPLSVGDTGITLVWIPAGTFRMGPSAYPKLLATVHLTRGFWMDRTDVTQGQWQALMGSNPSQYPEAGSDAPVDSVTWNQAMDFCRRLTAVGRAQGTVPNGYTYRLPTEAEWEYACRAGGATMGPVNGDGVLADMAWYSDNSGGHPHPVATRRPNAWGLYDMQGDVSEWCYDWLGAAQHGDVTDPAGPPYGTFRITRGGNWITIADHIELGHRLWENPDKGGARLGFRVVLAPEIQQPPPLRAPRWLTLPPGPPPPADSAGHPWIVRASGVGIRMQWVPSGTFRMGDKSPDGYFTARISRGFWLSRTEITQRQWEAVMHNNPSHFKDEGPDAPVDNVSFDDAMAFGRRLTRMARAAGQLPPGYEYRVPTEAEWEYACRAGTTGDVSGDGVLGDMAWYGVNSGGHSHHVALKKPNAWGLYDMQGNVWEACYDRFGIYPTGELTDPAGVSAGSMRVSRGGCWESADGTCGSSHRTANAADFKSAHTGMRLALAPLLPHY